MVPKDGRAGGEAARSAPPHRPHRPLRSPGNRDSGVLPRHSQEYWFVDVN